MSKTYSIFISFIILVVSIMLPISAFAYNADYLDYQKWSHNPNVVQQNINSTSSFGDLVGDIKYYVDNSDQCLYLCFNVSEPNITSNDDVKIEFTVSNSKESYNFSVNKDGIYQMQDGVLNNFTAYCNFETGSKHNGIYVVALDIHNKSNENYVDVVFHTIAKYKLNNIGKISVIVPTTTKPAKTTKSKVTNKSSNDSKSSKSNRTTKPKTTKYYNPNATYPASNKAGASTINSTPSKGVSPAEQELAQSNTVSYSVSNNETVVSKRATWIYIISAVIATIGVMLIIIGLVLKFVKPKEQEEKTKPEQAKIDDTDKEEFDF